MSDIGVLVTLDEESLKNRAVLDYTSRDFTSIRAQLIGLAKGALPDWNTAGEASDFGTLILELFAYMGDTLNFYIDRTASEAFLSTAVRTQSVYYIADMLGYEPIGQHSASVYLNFSMIVPDTAGEVEIPPVTLPKGTKIHNETDNAGGLIIFELNQAVTLNPGDTDISVFAEEGVTIETELLGTSLGVPNSEFILGNKGVIFGTISVISQEGYASGQWTFTSDLALARPMQNVFTTYLDDQGFTHVVFGDNSSGRIPPVNANMYAHYRFGVGAAANNLAEDSITVIVPPPNVNIDFVSVTNPSSPIGGSDPESIESLKYNIPRAGARIKSRAITLNDYADLALQVPGVAKSVAYGTVYTSVHVRIAPAGGEALPEQMAELCEQVEQYMADKILIGSTVIAEPDTSETIAAMWQNVYIRVNVHVIPTYNRSAVRTQVDAIIRAYLAFDSVDFGRRITVGSVYRAALSIQGVEWIDLLWLSPAQPPDAPPVSFAPDVQADLPANEALGSAPWQYSSTNTATDPGVNHFRINNATFTAATVLTFSATDNDAVAQGALLLGLKVGDHIVFRSMIDTWSWWDFIVTGAPTNNTTWFSVPVVFSRSSTATALLTNNNECFFQFLRYNPTPTSGGNVADINTDELMIPRIEPTEVIEEDEEWIELLPDEEERTHDGLWVVAEGGLAGT